MSLTQEDKQWINEQVKRLAEQMSEQFMQQLRLTKEQLEQKIEHLEQKVEHVEQKVDHVDQKIERVETALLTEFHKWASPAEMRQRSHSAALHALDLEVEALKDRVKKLEEK